ncbi:MAG TPA: hypothetical protein VIO14_06185 [Dehalococcoidia bacterium]
MLDPHQQHHLRELRGRLAWVRGLVPESPRYRLWLGDLIEFVHAVYGQASPQMAALTDALQTFRAPADAAEPVRRQAYLERLDAIERLLARWEAEAAGAP